MKKSIHEISQIIQNMSHATKKDLQDSIKKRSVPPYQGPVFSTFERDKERSLLMIKELKKKDPSNSLIILSPKDFTAK